MALRLPPPRRPKPPYPDRVQPALVLVRPLVLLLLAAQTPECLQRCCPHVLLVQRPPPVPCLSLYLESACFALPCRPNAPSPLR